MSRIEKTVFISYRRADRAWALSVFMWLTQRGYDAFIDYEGIGSGDFEAAIVENILSRAHFLILLTPATLTRCNEPGDWIRREIEKAIESRRNIVPLMLDGFSFGDARVKRRTTGTLSVLPRYNGLQIEVRSFEDDMLRLQRQFLNVAREAVIHPTSVHAAEIAAKQRAAAEIAPLPDYGDSSHYRDSGRGLTTSREVYALAGKSRTAKSPVASETFWEKCGLAVPKTVRVRWTNAARVVPTRYPVLSLFDRVQDADDFDALLALELKENERIRDEVGQVERVPRDNRIFGPGSGPIMAAFTHVNVQGSEVSDGSFGVFYAARDRRTAIVETSYHHSRFLQACGENVAMHLPMRLYHVQIDAVVYDLRAEAYWERIFRSDDYSLSQELGLWLYQSGASGLVYRNVVDKSGDVVALFNPKGASGCLHAAYLLYAWDGKKFTDFYERAQ